MGDVKAEAPISHKELDACRGKFAAVYTWVLVGYESRSTGLAVLAGDGALMAARGIKVLHIIRI